MVTCDGDCRKRHDASKCLCTLCLQKQEVVGNESGCIVNSRIRDVVFEGFTDSTCQVFLSYFMGLRRSEKWFKNGIEPTVGSYRKEILLIFAHLFGWPRAALTFKIPLWFIWLGQIDKTKVFIYLLYDITKLVQPVKLEVISVLDV